MAGVARCVRCGRAGAPQVKAANMRSVRSARQHSRQYQYVAGMAGGRQAGACARTNATAAQAQRRGRPQAGASSSVTKQAGKRSRAGQFTVLPVSERRHESAGRTAPTVTVRSHATVGSARESGGGIGVKRCVQCAKVILRSETARGACAASASRAARNATAQCAVLQRK